MRLRTQIVLPLLAIGVVAAVGLGAHVMRSAVDEATRNSLEFAASQAGDLRIVRSYYTEAVAGPAKVAGVDVTHEYAGKRGAIPLPATMVHDLSDRFGKDQGFSLRLYSDFPFPTRADGGARDAFEREAIERLRKHPEERFFRVEDESGVPTMRYAVADVMTSQTCVDCHNSHPQSPKRDWRVGDVRGVLEVVVPMDRAVAASRRAAYGTAGAVVLGVLAMIGVAAWLVERALGPLRRVANAAGRIAVGDLAQSVEHESNDEIGDLARAFRGSVDYVQSVARAAGALERGEVGEALVARSDHDALTRNVDGVRRTIAALLEELGALIRAAERGELDVRGDVSRFRGVYRELLDGANRMMDAVSRPLREARRVLDRVAARDLTAHAEGSYAGEYEQMMRALDAATANLREGLEEVATSSHHVAEAAAQIASNAEALAQGTTEQASALQETSAALTQLSSSTRSNAGGAQQAGAVVRTAKELCATGESSMVTMNDAMEKVRAATERTAAIIRDIDEIAFQINLLALNAAVEAARAGDAGRGFAVVADEVRTLAQRSKDAARRTESLIGDSMLLARRGEELSSDVRANLRSIVNAVEEGHGSVETIARTSEEQARGLDQVAKAMAEMDQVTQANAASSEQSSSAAEELANHARALAELVARFDIGANGPRRTTRALAR